MPNGERLDKIEEQLENIKRALEMLQNIALELHNWLAEAAPLGPATHVIETSKVQGQTRIPLSRSNVPARNHDEEIRATLPALKQLMRTKLRPKNGKNGQKK
jgi:hypothetical protein